MQGWCRRYIASVTRSRISDTRVRCPVGCTRRVGAAAGFTRVSSAAPWPVQRATAPRAWMLPSPTDSTTLPRVGAARSADRVSGDMDMVMGEGRSEDYRKDDRLVAPAHPKQNRIHTDSGNQKIRRCSAPYLVRRDLPPDIDFYPDKINIILPGQNSSPYPLLRMTPEPPHPRYPGRPRLGVTAREVTLLPRHWDWLAAQPGGASVTLRMLVEQATSATDGQHHSPD